jgi:hypothetical protein
MAKESEREELSNYPNYLDRTVNYLYRIGMFHSIIWHTSILLILCLSVSSTISKKISIEISFQSDDIGVSLEEPVEISFDEKESAFGSDESELLEEAIASNSNTETVPEEIVPEPFEAPIEESSSNLISEVSVADLSTQLVKESPRLQRQQATETPPSINQSPDSNNGVVGELIKSIPTSGSSGLNNGFGETGAALEIGRRLSAAGAKTGDVQVSIGWNTTDDIDVHVFFRSFSQNSYISWTNRHGVCGGMLDVDMNANRYYLNNKPVENIFWPSGNSPYGEFVVSLHHFRNWSGARSVPVILIIKVDGETKVINTESVYGRPMVEVARFNRVQN